MTRQEAIERWTPLVRGLCAAQEEICHEWLPRLRAVEGKPKEEVVAVLDEYYTAIATQIASHLTDEELATAERPPQWMEGHSSD